MKVPGALPTISKPRASSPQPDHRLFRTAQSAAAKPLGCFDNSDIGEEDFVEMTISHGVKG